MADVDLFRDAYRTKLGREASDEELQGWVSGQYGGGSVQDRLNQIANSHEAQQRNPQIPQLTEGPFVPTPSPFEVPRLDGGAPPPVLVPGQNPNVSRPMNAGGGDPWASAREGLANVYRQFLGRDPGEGDVDKWLTGAYGHGSGLSDYDKYVAAIMGSHEARNYRPAAPPGENPYQNLEYWMSQGVPATDIFDPMTGQLRAGWSRTGSGYQRTGASGSPQTGGATNAPAPRSSAPGDIQQWFQQLTQGKPPSPQTLKQLEPILNQYGIKLGPPNARGWSDGIILPDGTFYDVIEAATENGGKAWSFFIPSPNGGVQAPGNQYSDPYTQFLEMLIKNRIGGLGGVNDPNRMQLMNAYQQRANTLGAAAEPEYQALVKRLEERFGQLQGPGYTGAEGEAIRTQALDPIESDRAAAKKRVIEQLSARGLTLESGIAQQALMEVDKAFDQMRASTQTVLTTNDLQRREGRQQRADAVKGSLYDISQARSREQLDVFGAMEALESVMRAEEDARGREQISLGGALADLGPQRMQLAMQAAGMGGNPSSMFQNLMQLAQMNQQSSLFNQNRSSQLWSGLGSVAAILANAGR